MTQPHNPTGVAADPAAIDEIGRIAARVGAHVLVDEVYKRCRPATESPSAASARRRVRHDQQPDEVVRPVEPACRLGHRVRPASPIASAARATSSTGPARSSPSGWRVLAFEHLDALHARARRRCSRGTRRSLTRFSRSQPRAGVGAVGRNRRVSAHSAASADATPFVERLMRERRTAVVPGAFFEAPAHFRLGYGGETSRLEKGLEQLAAALDELQA